MFSPSESLARIQTQARPNPEGHRPEPRLSGLDWCFPWQKDLAQKCLIPDPAPKDTGLNPACEGSSDVFCPFLAQIQTQVRPHPEGYRPEPRLSGVDWCFPWQKDLAQKCLIPDPAPKDTGLNPACEGSTDVFCPSLTQIQTQARPRPRGHRPEPRLKGLN